MINRKLTSVILAASVMTTAFCSCNFIAVPSESSSDLTTASVSEEPTPTPVPTQPPVEVIVKTKDGKTIADTDYVRLMDDVKPEMMNPEYWIKEGDDQILMNDEQIAAFNDNNRAVILAGDNKTRMPHINDFEETLDGNVLRTFLSDNAKSVPSKPEKFFLNGQPTTKEYWDELVRLSNMDAVPDEIKVQYGFTTKRMSVRMFPTEDRVFESADDKFFDSLIYSECMPYMPVVVLHESADGEYLYVVFDSFSAWLRKDAVALCHDKDEWTKRQSPDKWLVVTAREIRLGNDPHSPLTTNLVLPMGTRMELVPVKDAPDIINQRTTYGDYVVKVPARGEDGYIKDEYVLIPVSDDVNVGYLPLTPANIVRQAFKLLGDRYGWGGDLQANDCTGITREIYRCFGILLPRVGQSSSKGVYKVDMKKMSSKEKLAEIEKLAPGSLISFPGHMTIYIGTVDGVPYVISSVGTFVQPAPGSKEVLHPRSVVLSSLNVRRRNLVSWLDTATTALTIKPEEEKSEG